MCRRSWRGLRVGLFGGGWLRGAQSAEVSGRDETGVKSFELVRGASTSVKVENRSCDFTLPVPCGPANAEHRVELGVVDTAAIPDGSYEVFARVTDSAGNQSSSSPETVQIDNTPPVAPIGLGTSGRHVVGAADADDQLGASGWAGGADHGAQVRVCPDGGATCLDAVGIDDESAASRCPTQGCLNGSCDLVDEAGNVSATPAPIASATTRSAPPAPGLGCRGSARRERVRGGGQHGQ